MQKIYTMKQVVRKSVALANNIDQTKPIYTLIVDGNNLLKISLVNKTLLNDKGEEYGAVYNFLRILGQILQMRDFETCTVCWDGYMSGILRYNIYPEYKANRGKNYEVGENQTDYDKYISNYCKNILKHSNKKQATVRGESEDESFQRQRAIIQEILDELFVRQYMFDNVEGDDIIAYRCINRKPNEKIVVVSADKDITQLINEDVCIYNPRKKKAISTKNSVEELGITHENIVLEKTLCGDVSDNIKGVKGLGETSFLKLFPEFKTRRGTLNDVIERSKELLDSRKSEKKKPLKSLENIINQITDGCQGNKLFEINWKIVDLSKPLLTEDAEKELKETIDAPIDPEGRQTTNVYKIIQQNSMNLLLDENKFGSLFGMFERLISSEKKLYEKSN